MEYTVEEAQKIFEQLIDDALAGKEVIIVKALRYQLVPITEDEQKPRIKQAKSRKRQKRSKKAPEFRKVMQIDRPRKTND